MAVLLSLFPFSSPPPLSFFSLLLCRQLPAPEPTVLAQASTTPASIGRPHASITCPSPTPASPAPRHLQPRAQAELGWRGPTRQATTRAEIGRQLPTRRRLQPRATRRALPPPRWPHATVASAAATRLYQDSAPPTSRRYGCSDGMRCCGPTGPSLFAVAQRPCGDKRRRRGGGDDNGE